MKYPNQLFTVLSKVDRHLTHECRSNLIHCPFKHVGCQHQVSIDLSLEILKNSFAFDIHSDCLYLTSYIFVNCVSCVGWEIQPHRDGKKHI